MDRLLKEIEAVIFVSVNPISERKIANILGVSVKEVKKCLDKLVLHYADHHAIELLKVAGGWQFYTKPEFADLLKKVSDENEVKIKLSKAAMEALAVIAYNQPVTRTEIEEIRGVRSERVIETLLKYGLIKTAGRKKTAGGPLLYRTTDKFLEVFGINSVDELPDLSELEAEGLIGGDEDIDEGKIK